jgi:hypothetical protein
VDQNLIAFLEWQVTALLDLQAYYTGGQGGAVDDELANLLGRAPRAMDQFVTEFRKSFQAPAGNA